MLDNQVYLADQSDERGALEDPAPGLVEPRGLHGPGHSVSVPSGLALDFLVLQILLHHQGLGGLAGSRGPFLVLCLFLLVNDFGACHFCWLVCGNFKREREKV